MISPRETDSALSGPMITGEKIIDIYLLMILQFIFSVGLYELFIGPLETPEWLKIATIDQLMAAVASVMALFLAIFFAHLAMNARQMIDVAYGGGRIAAVIDTLVFITR
ncbi:MAG: YqhA family protein [Spirochaetes bacterium]|nr:YqhA family protein [Spirochaetota bacterium]